MSRPRADRGEATGPRFPVAALYVAAESEYWGLAAECFDLERDARNYAGTLPVVAHPPCRGWSRLKAFAKVPAGELELGGLAIAQVRRHGGVLEHPSGSGLWKHHGLSVKSGRDSFGGFFLPVEQQWWGHPAVKRTWLYVCGIDWRDVPPIPMKAILSSGGYRPMDSMTKAARSKTPALFALWLLDLASRCRPS